MNNEQRNEQMKETLSQKQFCLPDTLYARGEEKKVLGDKIKTRKAQIMLGFALNAKNFFHRVNGKPLKAPLYKLISF